MDDDLSRLDDAALTQRVAAGDERAVAALYDRYATPAFSLALKLAGDPQRAADLVQRAFTRIWADAPRFDANSMRFGTWLLSLVNHLAQAAAPVPAPAPAAPRAARAQRARWCPAPVPVSRHD
jgi:hypothetical protein